MILSTRMVLQLRMVLQTSAGWRTDQSRIGAPAHTSQQDHVQLTWHCSLL